MLAEERHDRQRQKGSDTSCLTPYNNPMPIPLLLHARHRAHPPVTYDALGDWVVPWRFGAFEQEYRTLRAGAGLVDYSRLARVEITGPDRVTFLHSLLSQEIRGVPAGRGCRAALLTPTAHVEAELLVLAEPDAHQLLCDAHRAARVAACLERQHVMEQLTIVNHERREAALAVQGPRTAAVLSSILSCALPEGEQAHAAGRVGGVPIRVVRHSLTGDPGVLLLVPADEAATVWHQVQRAGAEPVGWEALNAARLEAGVPWEGVDFDASRLLPETGLETRLASDAKGCYLGQEIVARMARGSANKRLVGLRVTGGVVPHRDDAVEHAGAPSGQITSACVSPRLGTALALGYVTRPWYAPGTAVEIVRDRQRVTAAVIALPVPRPAAEEAWTGISPGGSG